MRGYAFPILSILTLTALAILLAFVVGNVLGGDVIAYSARCGYDAIPIIYVVDIERQVTHPLTTPDYVAVQPAWSPDGKRIAYVAWTGIDYALYVMDANGGNRRALTDFNEYNANPAWSPDSKRIAFISERRESARILPVFQLYIADLDTNITRRLTYADLHVYSPDWLRDGDSILVAALTDRNGARNNLDLYIVDPESGVMQAITDDAAVDHADPNISPDGERIVIAARDTDYRGLRIAVLDLPDGDMRALLAFSDNDILDSIQWSPDGKRIGFVRLNVLTLAQGLYVIRADGGEAHRVDLPCDVVGFSWRPDS
jgi:Tol biopolymer transport system component